MAIERNSLAKIKTKRGPINDVRWYGQIDYITGLKKGSLMLEKELWKKGI